MTRELLQQALDALEGAAEYTALLDSFTMASVVEAVKSLREAIAQPVQRPWAALTDDEAQELHDQWQEAIEAKLKEKNA